ncbi:MAG: YdcF family protein [Fusobacteriaceae bacterium]|jgi:uncharacterized SAM-binding protein YcdF (DUF218 family)|nr:YdcF family protein [Fusobacteriaceae bacterium]
MYRYRQKTPGKFSFFIGVLLIIWAVIIQLNSNFNIGYPMMMALGLVIMAWGRLRARLPLAVRLPVYAAGALALGAMLFLFLYGKKDTADFHEKALIVLGAGIRGDKPSRNLLGRLDCALSYLERNPGAVVIVSGGQGEDEDYTEAEIMKRWLVNHGVAEDRVYKEERAASTAENFRYSKEILDNLYPESWTAAFVTSEYHMFRSAQIAGRQGITVSRYGAPLAWYLYPAAYLRETLACAYSLIFKKKSVTAKDE